MFIIIINSKSGRKRYEKIATILTKKLDIPFVSYHSDQFQENELWSSVKISIEKTKKITGIIIIGGDGTLHHAINHLHQYDISFGLIPAGSGNDFAKALKIPINPKKAVNRIITNSPKRYDLAVVNDTLIHSVVGMGVDAETAIRSSNSPLKYWLNKAFIGKLTYLFTFFLIIQTFKPFQLEFIFNDDSSKTYDRVWLLAIGNTRYYGGGIPICPKANPQDGKLEVILVHNLPLYKLLLVLPTVFFRMHTFLPYVERFESKGFTVKTKQAILVQGDGEKVGYTPQKVSIKPQTIKIF